MLEIKDFWMFGQGRTSEVNVRFGRTEQFGLEMAELFGRTECSFEHYSYPDLSSMKVNVTRFVCQVVLLLNLLLGFSPQISLLEAQ